MKYIKKFESNEESVNIILDKEYLDSAFIGLIDDGATSKLSTYNDYYVLTINSNHTLETNFEYNVDVDNYIKVIDSNIAKSENLKNILYEIETGLEKIKSKYNKYLNYQLEVGNSSDKTWITIWVEKE